MSSQGSKNATIIVSLYRDSLWNVLTGKNIEAASSIVLHDVREIETWILRFLSAPVSVPSSTKVEVSYNYEQDV